MYGDKMSVYFQEVGGFLQVAKVFGVSNVVAHERLELCHAVGTVQEMEGNFSGDNLRDMLMFGDHSDFFVR